MAMRTVVVTFVVMLVPFAVRALLASVHKNREMRRGDSALRKRPRLEDDARNAERVEFRDGGIMSPDAPIWQSR